jgi:hypothetical protein
MAIGHGRRSLSCWFGRIAAARVADATVIDSYVALAEASGEAAATGRHKRTEPPGRRDVLEQDDVIFDASSCSRSLVLSRVQMQNRFPLLLETL